MDLSKKEAVDFCVNANAKSKFLDIWLTIILTFGLAVIIFPILIWLIYRYVKAKRIAEKMKFTLMNNPNIYDTIEVFHGVGYTRFGTEVQNSIVLELNGESFEVPNLYIWFSKYSKQELINILLQK